MSGKSLARFHWQICGQVQGVGFRPFVFRRAEACHLSGFVRNDLSGVCIEAQGERDQLEQFDRALRKELPPLALIKTISYCEVRLDSSPGQRFRIESSCYDGKCQTGIAVDTAVCEECLHELLGTEDRRAEYALTNCTACGPRYSILRALPYDRPNTTMASFLMCPACREEYTNPHDRRFHAQPIACHDCGPCLQAVNSLGQPLPGDPIAETVRVLQHGGVVAIKGIGGFHLAVRALDWQAVDRLRRSKHRGGKPLAVMCPTMEDVEAHVELSRTGAAMLQSTARPIVLARRRATAPVAENVAPGLGVLGVMLPYTPIHHLLFAADPDLGTLVMTSGNLTDETLVIDNEEALERLGGLCDLQLWHDRPIARPVDDSVVLDMGTAPPLPIRRARGFVPRSLTIPVPPPADMECGLCVGGELKNAIALVRGSEVFLSQHLGDLKHPLTWTTFESTIADLSDLFDIRPQWIACDLHPVYRSSIHAESLAQLWGVPLLRIQHHHAHAASLMAERRCREPVLAVVCDGVGYGADGTIWGGELLLADLHAMHRIARLRPLQLAGGDAAAVDTRRCALALLYQVVGEDLAAHPLTSALYPELSDRDLLVSMLRNNVNCVSSSAAGRVFDGFAALLGLCRKNHFEAEAGLRLEAKARQATRVVIDEPLFALRRADDEPELMEIDLAPLVEQTIALQQRGVSTSELALLVHVQLAKAWESAVVEAVEQTGIDRAALSGGVFCNRLLSDLLHQRLTQHGLQVMRHACIPCNDGGLALGQAAVAAASLRRAARMSEQSSTSVDAMRASPCGEQATHKSIPSTKA